MTTRKHPHDPLEDEPREPATASLEAKIAELESALAEAKDRHLRLAADFDNYKKRVRQEQMETIQHASSDLIARVLPVLDDLHNVLEHKPEGIDESWVKGLELSVRKLEEALGTHGLEPVDAVAHERFKEASEAYAVLSDPDRRRSYDMFGHSAVGAGGPAVDFSDMPFADIFDTFFGGGFGARARRERSNRGDDLRYDMTITFDESFTGVEKQIDVPRLAACDRCSGSGAEPGTGQETCPGCGGSGQIRRSAQSFFGQVVTTATCPTCGGG